MSNHTRVHKLLEMWCDVAWGGELSAQRAACQGQIGTAL
jgi:hypothetical protein